MWCGWCFCGVGCLVVKKMTKKTAITTHLHEVSRGTGVVLFRQKGCMSCTGYNLPCCVNSAVGGQRGLFMRATGNFASHFQVSVHARRRMATVHPSGGRIRVGGLSANRACARACSGLMLSPKTRPLQPNVRKVKDGGVFALHGIPSASAVGGCIGARGPGHTVIINKNFVKLRVTRGLRSLNVRISIMRVTGRIVTPLSFSVTTVIRQRLASGKIKLRLRSNIDHFRRGSNNIAMRLHDNGRVTASVILLDVKMHPRAGLTGSTKLTVKRQNNVTMGSCVRASSTSVCTLNSTIRMHRLMAKRPTLVPLTKPTGGRKHVITSGVMFNGGGGCPKSVKASVTGMFSLAITTTNTGTGLLRRGGVPCVSSCARKTSRTKCCPKTIPLSVGVLFTPRGKGLLNTRVINFGNMSGHVRVLTRIVRQNNAIRSLTRLRRTCTPPCSSTGSPIGVTKFITRGVLGGGSQVVR